MTRFLLITASMLALSACSYLPDWMGGIEEKETKLPGERVSLLDAERAMHSESARGIAPTGIPEARSNTIWPTANAGAVFGYQNVKAGMNESDRAAVGDGNSYPRRLLPAPVIANGVIYGMDADGSVSAQSLNDPGERLWQADVPREDEEGFALGGGLAYAQEMLFVTGGDGTVAALQARTGRLIWKRPVGVPLRSAPMPAEGKLFVITLDNQLFALDALSGAVVWKHRGTQESASYTSSVLPVARDGVVVVAYPSGELFGLRTVDGGVAWNDSLVMQRRTAAADSLTGVDASPVIAANTVYAVSTNGLFLASDLYDGRTRWEAKISSSQTPWVAGDTVFLISTEPALVALDRADGTVRWSTPLNKTSESVGKNDPTPRWLGPVMVNGQLLIANPLGEAFTFDPILGKQLKRIDIPGKIGLAPAVAQGRLVWLDQGANLTVMR